MSLFKERYLVDEKGERVGVFLDIADYQKLLEDLFQLAKMNDENPSFAYLLISF